MRKLYFALRFTLPHLLNLVKMNMKHYHIGKQFTTYGLLFLRGKGKVSFGEKVTITSCRETNPIGGDVRTTIYAKRGSTITIGNNVGMSNVTLVSQKSIRIEDDVMLGGSVKIYDTDFHALDYNERMKIPDRGIKSAPVYIKNGAFIGAHSIILKGVTIGEKSIVGAGSVVTHDIPDAEIWAGAPAKFVRKL